MATWLRSWYELYAKPNVRPATADRYLLIIETYTIPRIGKIKLNKLTSRDLQKLYKDLMEHGRVQKRSGNGNPGLSSTTVRSVHLTLHCAFERAVKERLIRYKQRIRPPGEPKRLKAARHLLSLCLHIRPGWFTHEPSGALCQSHLFASAGYADAIGVRHKTVAGCLCPGVPGVFANRPLFLVTGATTSFAKRRALRRTLKESGNGIPLCTQQSLPSSVNFEHVNKVITPKLHYNNASMSQFYMRFVRYNSTQDKDIYFPPTPEA